MLYLDHNATTAMAPEVLEVFLGAAKQAFANPSSSHAAGQAARRAMDQARAQVAGLIGAQPPEIVFTGGGTEANNLAILGLAEALSAQGAAGHIITSAVEHHAVLRPCRRLAANGFTLTELPVDAQGQVAIATFVAALRPDTRMVSLMLANNEVGTIQPVAEIARICAERRIWLHCDAVQAVGKIPIDVQELGVDLLSLSGHKFHGPKGVGALYVKENTPLQPVLTGGSQERRLRPGTENVPGIAALGAAAALAAQDLNASFAHQLNLRSHFERHLQEAIPDAVIHGLGATRLPNTTSVRFPGIKAGALLIELDLRDVAVSAGAACATANPEPSHVLVAMGLSPEEARATLRFSAGREHQLADMDRAVALLSQALSALRQRRETQ